MSAPKTTPQVQAPHDLQSLLQSIQTQDTAQRICFRANILPQYFKANSKEITQFMVRNLITIDQERIQGFGAVLANLMKTFADQLTPTYLFLTVNDTLTTMKDVRTFGQQKLMRLQCILSCFLASVFSGNKMDKCVQLLSSSFTQKIGDLNTLAASITHQALEICKSYGDMTFFVESHMKNFYGVMYLMEQNKVLSTEWLFNGIDHASEYAFRDFFPVLVQYLNKFPTLINALVEKIISNEQPNKYVLFLQVLPELKLNSSDMQMFIKKLLDQHFINLVFEASNPKAPMQQDFVQMFDVLFGQQELHDYYVEKIMGLKTHYFFVTKCMHSLAAKLNEAQAATLMKHVIVLMNQQVEVLQYFNLVVALSKVLDLETVMQVIQSLFGKLGYKLVLTQLEELTFNINEQFKNNFLKLIWQIILSQNEFQALIYQISEQLIEMNSKPFFELMKSLKVIATGLNISQENELSGHAMVILQNYKELISQFTVLMIIQQEMQPVSSRFIELTDLLVQIIQNSNDNKAEDFDQFTSEFYQRLGFLVLKLSQVEGQLAKDFCNKIVKNFSRICYDDFFDVFINGLNLAENLNDDEALEEGEEGEEGEEEGEIEETDLFTYNKELEQNLNEDEEEDEEEEEIEELADNEEETQEKEKVEESKFPTFKEPNEDEYDRILANAVKAVLFQKNNHMLMDNLNVAMKSATYLEILSQNNPERPVVWEVLFQCIRTATNPTQNVHLEEGEKLTSKDRETVTLLQNKLFNLIKKELVAGLNIEDIFDNGNLIIAEDLDFVLTLLSEGSQVQKQAASIIVSQIMKKLSQIPEHNAIREKYLSQICALYTAKNQILKSFIQQIVSCPVNAQFVFNYLVNNNQSTDKLLEVVKLSQIAVSKESSEMLFKVFEQAMTLKDRERVKAMYNIIEIQKHFGNIEQQDREKYRKVIEGEKSNKEVKELVAKLLRPK
ncbi:Conserved_hypothetical protein [Hexamita inflata]|uniref:Uncharacterized protein n=1 Tax=Hexamita inflata TaxID=28002 RepID=A0AA86R1X8_9EUKA|nr:Conserved hypothetical protein [Hexamita inflata]